MKDLGLSESSCKAFSSTLLTNEHANGSSSRVSELSNTATGLITSRAPIECCLFG